MLESKIFQSSVILGGSEFFGVQGVPRIEREVFESFLLHLGIWLGCYGQEWRYFGKTQNSNGL